MGHPSRVSRKGKAGPSEAGKGKYSPPANPERVTAGASERRDGGVLLQRSKKEGLSRDHENTWSESPETPVLIPLTSHPIRVKLELPYTLGEPDGLRNFVPNMGRNDPLNLFG